MVYKRAWAEISLDNMAHNIAVIRGLLPAGTDMMGIVKADAYGHGAVDIARAMLFNGADSLGVAICEEGVQLRQGGIEGPVLVMGFTPAPLLDSVVKHNLIQTVFSKDGARALSEAAARHNKRAVIHIKIDTGMSRLGFLPRAESINEICAIAQDSNLFVQGIYTHLATSDQLDHEFVFEQQARFDWVLKELQGQGLNIMKRHIANSGAVAQIARLEHTSNIPLVDKNRFMDIARVGILLYGLPPSAEMAETCAPLGLKPVMRIKAQVSQVKRLAPGVGISYGHIYKTKRESTIAVLPIGYADGYPRRLSHGGKVLVRGQLAPVAGAICMDQCMIDVTDIPEVSPGDHVTLLGNKEEGISADDLADIVGTISYEIVCGIGKRVPRVYVHNV
ncbi:MAG: alanine racemase [Defluviitaleaceae bacterium]|nr:alanine racemase [Defluviitaleaceae bacterium]